MNLIHRHLKILHRGVILPSVLAALGLGLAACDVEDERAEIEVRDTTAELREEMEESPDLASEARQSETAERESPEPGMEPGMEPGAAGPGESQAEGPYYGTTPASAASALVTATDGSGVSGEVRFLQDSGTVEISGQLTGLTEGEHGLHIHQNADCSDAGKAAGEHFAPDNDPHGAPGDGDAEHHVGDLGNIVADADGRAIIDIEDTEMTLDSGPKGIIGRAVVVHAQPDDLESQPAGGSGDPVACGVINGERVARNTGR